MEGGRSATHVVSSSARPLGRRRGVAPVDHLAAARAAERRIDNSAIGCARTVQLRIAIGCCEGRHAYATTNRYGACNADTNAGRYSDTKARHYPNSNGHAATYGDTRTHAYSITDANARAHSDTNAGTDTDTDPGSDTDTDAGSDPDAGSGAPDLQPRLHDRHGERGVEQPHWE